MAAIKNRFTDQVIFTKSGATMAETVQAAIANGVNLHNADFDRMDLRGVDFRRADLYYANFRNVNAQGVKFRYAQLYGADLCGGDFTDADLYAADLRKADCFSADFSKANLQHADVQGTSLRGVRLKGTEVRGADFRGTDLRGATLLAANIEPIRVDFFRLLTNAGEEGAVMLLGAIERGGLPTNMHECPCIAGVLFPTCQCGGRPDAGRPVARWLLAIRPGDNPEKNFIARVTRDWVRDWIAEQPKKAV